MLDRMLMNKIAIFNVGAGMSAYCQLNKNRFIIDLGSSSDFSPTQNFLLPLARSQAWGKDKDGKFFLDQLILSHLDNDHIVNYDKFSNFFSCQWITVPNDNPMNLEKNKVKRSLISENDLALKILDQMRLRCPGRKYEKPDIQNPLIFCDNSIGSLHYLSPTDCEELDFKSTEDYKFYANNISLVVYLVIKGTSILFPGDIMSNGMKELINKDFTFKDKLQRIGVDFLVTPHHGLDTSFPDSLYKTMKYGRTRLNIIPEKKLKKASSDNRSDVSTKYSDSEFSMGYNVEHNEIISQRSIITSVGHIVIDFDNYLLPKIKVCKSNEELLTEFV